MPIFSPYTVATLSLFVSTGQAVWASCLSPPKYQRYRSPRSVNLAPGRSVAGEGGGISLTPFPPFRVPLLL